MTTSRRETLIGLGAMGTAALLPAVALADEPISPFAGTWSGALEVGPLRLRLTLQISAGLKAALTSIDQGNVVIPASSIRADGDRIVISFPSIAAGFDGRLNAAGGLAGTFTQQGQPLPLAFTRVPGTLPQIAGPPTAPPVTGPLTLEKLRAHRVALGTPAMGAGWQRGSARPSMLVDGLRSAQAQVAVRSGDKWHLGSITKSMTALLVARAVEAGVMQWDSSIGAVLGGKVAGIHADFASVTVLHLLSHNSGLPGAAAMNDLPQYQPKLTPGVRQERLRLVQSVLSREPAARAGSKFEYANAGCVVVGAMLEVLTGKPWEQLIRERLFRPLGLRSAGIGLPGREGRVDQPLGHRIGADGRREAHFTDLPAVLGPAGLTHMNLADLLKYVAAHGDKSARLLRPESWDQLHKVHFGGAYALGWLKVGERLFHNGSNNSWVAEVAFDRQAGVCAAFVSNDAASQVTGGSVLRAAGLAAMTAAT